MLYQLFQYLNENLGFPRLGVYVSFRVAMGFLTAFALCLVVAPRFIRWQREHGLGESHDKLGSKRRKLIPAGKSGTPTMGGLLIGAGVLFAALLWCKLSEPLVIGGLFVFVVAGLIGLRDDQLKLFHPTRAGLSFKHKLALLCLLGLAIAAYLRYIVWTGDKEFLQVLVLPFMKDANLSLTVFAGLPFLLLVAVTICGSSNAVNLADGMDGLAAGCLLIAGVTLMLMTYIIGRVDFSAYLFVLNVEGASELSVLLAAMLGATFAFLWFNAAPAQLFMGDVGSLSLGALLGYSAVACRMELSLLVVGGVFVAEAVSVLIQVTSYKLRRKRVFLCAPIHHHFQKMGVPETKIVIRFWITSVILSCLSLVLFKLR